MFLSTPHEPKAVVQPTRRASTTCIFASVHACRMPLNYIDTCYGRGRLLQTIQNGVRAPRRVLTAVDNIL